MSAAASTDGARRHAAVSSLFAPATEEPAPHAPASRTSRRDSVLALGSIEHLQRFYADEGLASDTRPDVLGLSAAPALGGAALAGPPRGLAAATDEPDTSDISLARRRSSATSLESAASAASSVGRRAARRPPPPSTYKRPPFPHVSADEADVRKLAPRLAHVLARSRVLWGLDASASSDAVDVQLLLATTSELIAIVRQYLYALPAESWASPAASDSAAQSERRRKNAFRRQSSFYGMSLPSTSASPSGQTAKRRPSLVPQVTPTSSPRLALKALPDNVAQHDTPEQPIKVDASLRVADASASPTQADPLVRVRRAALLLLSDLRDLKQRYAFGRNGPEQHAPSREDPFAAEPPAESRAQSDTKDAEREPQTVRLEDLPAEVEHARAYLAVVDDVLGASLGDATKTSTPTPDCTSLGSADVPIHLVRTMSLGQTLPAWAEVEGFESDRLDRAFALLQAALPPSIGSKLPRDRSELLGALSDGQLLCISFNTALRRSQKPWGIIEEELIHDLRRTQSPRDARSALELPGELEPPEADARAGHKTGWTFRRTENLCVWAAALRLRYDLQHHASHHVPTKRRAASESHAEADTSSSVFDAPTIAQRLPDWDTQLEDMLVRWADAVAREARDERD